MGLGQYETRIFTFPVAPPPNLSSYPGLTQETVDQIRGFLFTRLGRVPTEKELWAEIYRLSTERAYHGGPLLPPPPGVEIPPGEPLPGGIDRIPWWGWLAAAGAALYFLAGRR
jgi:hypothetical protein